MQAERSLANVHSCKTPPKLDTGRWPLGLELIVTAFQTARQQRLLRLMSEIVEKTGSTFEQSLLGSRGIDTVAPANVEAILSTKFTGDYPPCMRTADLRLTLTRMCRFRFG
jgi:hypothetical protein